MPTATVHYYFRNKQHLYEAVLKQIVHLWFTEISNIEDNDDPMVEIEKYVRSKMTFSRKYAEASRIFANDMLGGHTHIREEIRDQIRPIVERKCELIRSWIDRGQFQPVDPLNVFFMIWGATEFYANFTPEVNVFFDDQDMTDGQYETAIDTVVRLILDGCRGPTAANAPLQR